MFDLKLYAINFKQTSCIEIILKAFIMLCNYCNNSFEIKCTNYDYLVLKIFYWFLKHNNLVI